MAKWMSKAAYYAKKRTPKYKAKPKYKGTKTYKSKAKPKFTCKPKRKHDSVQYMKKMNYHAKTAFEKAAIAATALLKKKNE